MQHNATTNDDGRRVSTILLSVGVMPSRSGFRYLKQAILIYNKSNDRSMMAIRNEVATMFGISAGAVERDMRSALDMAAMRNWLVKLNDIFGIEVIDANTRVTCKEFIALVSELLDRDRQKG